MRTLVNLRFEKGDPVREYWLARGEGFRVETRGGRVVGRVLDSVFDPDEQRVVGLVVRERVLGAVPGLTSELPADRIAAAVPGRETFVLDGAGEEKPSEPRQPRQPRLAPAAAAAGAGAKGAARRVAPAGPWLAEAAREVARVIRIAAAAIVAWLVGFGAWAVAAGRALAVEGRRAARALAADGRHRAGETRKALRRRWSPPPQ
jgi:hypothetical protein